VVPNAFVLTYKPLPTGSNDQATFWLGSKLLKTVSLMGALLLIAALNSATTASLKAGEIPVLSFVLILAPEQVEKFAQAASSTWQGAARCRDNRSSSACLMPVPSRPA
jgi:hypothetical protein